MLKQTKILIIEDDKTIALVLDEYVAQLNYEHKVVESAEDGLREIKDWQPELILLDVHLPKMTGIELLDVLKADDTYQNLQVLIISSDSTDETRIVSLAKGADDFLRKPINQSELVIKLETHLTRRKRAIEFKAVSLQLGNEKEKLMQYFSNDVISKILNSDKKQFLGENIPATIMFLDIRNFTGISEKLTPNEVAVLLNLLFSDLMDIIFKHNGSVNKMIGDAILATFGAPVSSGNDAENAAKCALDILEVLTSFNTVKPRFLHEDIRIGIGIASGNVFAGNIGSYRRMEYTVIGDVVNTASRLEGLTKQIKGDIIIDSNTQSALEESFNTRKINIKSIRGKSQEVVLFELIRDENKQDVSFF